MYIAIDPGSKWTGIYIPELKLEEVYESYHMRQNDSLITQWKSFNNIDFIIEKDGFGTVYYDNLLNWISNTFTNYQIHTYLCSDAMKYLFRNILTKNERKEQLSLVYNYKTSVIHTIDAIIGYIYFLNTNKFTNLKTNAIS